MLKVIVCGCSLLFMISIKIKKDFRYWNWKENAVFLFVCLNKIHGYLLTNRRSLFRGNKKLHKTIQWFVWIMI